MSWNKVKKMFKRKPKRDVHVALDPGIRDMTPYELPSNMKVHAKFIGMADTPKGSQTIYKWEINGVIIEALDILDAQRKYLRRTK